MQQGNHKLYISGFQSEETPEKDNDGSEPVNSI